MNILSWGVPNIEKMKSKNNIKGLIKALHYKKDPHIREKAAQAFGDMPVGENTQVVECLIETLKDSNERVRSSAVKSLTSIKNITMIAPFCQALKDHESFVRQVAAQILGQIKDPKAIESLVVALEDESTLVQVEVSQALKKLGWKPITIQDRINNSIAQKNWRELIEIGEPAVDPLIKILHNGKENEPQPNTTIRIYVASTLGEIKDDRVVEALCKALQDPKQAVRQSAAEALKNLKDTRAIEPLIEAINQCHGSNLSDSNFIEALGAIQDVRAREALNQVLQKGKTPLLRGSAAETLRKLKKEDERTLQIDAINHIKKMQERNSVESLIQALKDESQYIRMEVAKAIGKRKDIGTIESLVQALNDDSYRVRIEVVKALGEMEDLKVVEPLIHMVKDPNRYVRVEVIESLGKLGDINTVNTLLQELYDNDNSIRWHAKQALERIQQRNSSDPEYSSICKNLESQLHDFQNKEITRLAEELIKIGRTIGYLIDTPLQVELPEGFNEDLRNIQAREIGQRLHDMGGLGLMQRIGSQVRNILGGVTGRELEFAWNNIGEWHA